RPPPSTLLPSTTLFRSRRPGGCRGLGMGLAVTEELAVRTMTIAEPEPVPILYLESTTTFGGAINSLVHLLRGLDSGRYRPILATDRKSTRLNSSHVKIS